MTGDFVFALRNLKKNKALGFINTLGLSIGISACLVIYLIASYELSFDKFQPDHERIYRVYTQYRSEDVTKVYHGIFTGAVTKVRDNVAGVEAVTHFHNWWQKVTIVDGSNQPKVFDKGNNFIFAASDYFKVFSSYKWLEGNPESALTDPYKVVLTESRARIYFGKVPFGQLIGKEIIYQDSLHFNVSGIVADPKQNTDLNFTDFISYSTSESLGKNAPFSFDDPNTLNHSSQLFIKLAPGILPEQVTAQLPKYEATGKDGFVFETMLQPLSDLHFNTTLGIFDVSTRTGIKQSTVETLIALAVLLLIIAVINFINLETAQASKRAKEVGVRKVLGSSRWKLVRHFLIESFILTFISVLLAIGLSWFALLYFKEFIPQGVTLDLTNSDVLLFLGLCIVCVSLLAGIYPAFILSSYDPAKALKNLAHGSTGTSRSSLIRKGLTVFQFSFSQILIIATVVIGLQIRYMLNKDLGFTSQAIITFHTPVQENAVKRLVMRNSLEQIEGIETMSMQAQPPGGADGTNTLLLTFDNGKEQLEHWVNIKYGDANYLTLYDIKLLAGTNFLHSDSSKGFIINEAYLHKLGFENPIDVIGKTANARPIIGVVKDFHTESLHSPIQAVAIMCDAQKFHSFGLKLGLSKNSPEKLNETIAKIENAWNQIYPNDKFEFSFIDSRIKSFYESEQRINKLASIATGIAILISCLGLFALSSFTAIQRTKEIGIRKVLGASITSILMLLSSEFLKLILIAFVLSAPVAYYLSEKWLTDFAFKMDLSIWIFIVSGTVSIILALLTISFRTVNAARADPVKSLRYE